MDSALIARFVSLIKPAWQTEFSKKKISEPNMTFLACFKWFFDKYAKSDEYDREKNIELMKAPWSLQDDWIALKNQMEEGVIYGQLSGVPVPDYQVVNIAIRLILDTGLFEVEYGQWIARPENRKKWSHMKEFWPSKMGHR